MQKRKNPSTSIEAYRSLRPVEMAEIYRKIIYALSMLGEATTEECAAYLKIDHSKCWKRFNELMKMGLVYRPGNKRPLKSGRNGFTWMLTQEGVPKTTATEKALKGKSVSDYSKDLAKPSLQQAELFLRH